MAAQLDMLDPERPTAPPRAPLRTDYDRDRPPFAVCDDGWDRLVHLTRARDRLRRLGATDGEVVAGPRPTYRSKSRPEIETPL